MGDRYELKEIAGSRKMCNNFEPFRGLPKMQSKMKMPVSSPKIPSSPNNLAFVCPSKRWQLTFHKLWLGPMEAVGCRPLWEVIFRCGRCAMEGWMGSPNHKLDETEGEKRQIKTDLTFSHPVCCRGLEPE